MSDEMNNCVKCGKKCDSPYWIGFDYEHDNPSMAPIGDSSQWLGDICQECAEEIGVKNK